MSSRRPPRGKTGGFGPPDGEPWLWMTQTMMGSTTFRALGINARRVLDFLMYEHAAHGGQENGNLVAPYDQLEKWGVTKRDIATAIRELIVTGFIVKTFQGMRTEGGSPSRFELTWLSTEGWGSKGKMSKGRPASHLWCKVIERLHRDRIGNVRAVRRWLREQTKHAHGDG